MHGPWSCESAIAAMRLAREAAASDEAFLVAVQDILEVTESTPPNQSGGVDCLVSVLRSADTQLRIALSEAG